MKKILILMAIVGIQTYSFGQLNDYKYIVVPKQFIGFKAVNQFQTSTLVKFLLANEGFNVVYDDVLPQDLQDDPCLGLRTELIDDSNLFATKTRLSLTDCNGVLVLMTQEGRTKTKDFKQAYKEAISEAFGSLRGLNYKYEPTEKENTSKPITISFDNDVMSVDDKKLGKSDPTDSKMTKNPEPMVETNVVDTKKAPITKDKNMLYAQPIEEGYQLVDATPKVVYVLKSTSAPDVFLVSKDGKNGVVFKNEGKWFIEMDEKGGKPKELNIKF